MTYGLTETGFNRKTGAVIRTELEALFKGVFGEDLNTEPTTPEGNLIGALSEREAIEWELIEAVYLSQFRDSASGTSLDNAVSLIGIGRLAAQNSTVTLTLATLNEIADVDVLTGKQVYQPGTGVLWETTADATIPTATNVLEDLVVATIAWQSANTIRYTFSDSPDLSGVTIGDQLNCVDASFSANNGLMTITAVNDGSDYVDVTNLRRSDAAADETTGATCAITDGYVTVEAQSVDAGAFAASFGAINTIQNPVSNWDFVGNQAVADTGRATESDTDLRRRAAASTVSADGGTLNSIVARITAEVDGVSYVGGRENRTSTTDGNGLPPHSVEIVVVGGTDQDIADLIWETKPAGINTYGSDSASVTDDYGVSQTIYFSRVTEIPIYLKISLVTDATYPTDGDDQVKEALTDYFALLENGEDVLNHKLKAAISVTTGITAITYLYQGTSNPATVETNITIAASEIATLTAGDITIV